MGNPGKRPLPETRSAPASPRIAPEAPGDLGPVGLAAWGWIWQLGAPWLHPTLDRPVVLRLCRHYQEIEDWRELLFTDGRLDPAKAMTTGSMGQQVLNPAVGALRDLEAKTLVIERLIGLNPSDRSRLGIAEEKPASALQEFFSKFG